MIGRKAFRMSIQDSSPGRTLRDLADALGASLVGDGSFRVRQVVHPAAARMASDLALAIEPGAYVALATTAAGAAIVTEKLAPASDQGSETPLDGPSNYLVVKRPRYALALLLDLFDKQVQLRMGQANVKRWIPDILPLLTADDPFGVDTFATHRLPLEDAPGAYETFQKKQDGMIKTILQP